MRNRSTKKMTNFALFFGNKHNCPISHKSEEFKNFCTTLAQEHGLTKIIFQNQVHGAAGTYLDTKYLDASEKIKNTKPFELTGDFLITNQKNIGIGVLTADCLPIIFYDTKNHVAACIHAGWRSSVADICAHAIQMMFSRFKFNPEDLHVYFGPCAKSCCYQVQPDFLENLKNASPLAAKLKSQVIRKISTSDNSETLFFDNVLFNKLLLIDLGISSKNMHFEDNHCTMCSRKDFHSYRRDGEKALRQISFIALK